MLRRAMIFSILAHLLGFLLVAMSYFQETNTAVGNAQRLVAELVVTPRNLPLPQQNIAERQTEPVLLDKPVLLQRKAKEAMVFPHFSASTVAVELKPQITPIETQKTTAGREDKPVTSEMVGEGVPVDAATLGVYKINLARQARHFKRYPSLARENAWQGVVVIKLRGATSLIKPSVTIDQGSGYEVLDQQALEMMTQAVTQVPLPAGLRGLGFSLAVPVHYRLDN